MDSRDTTKPSVRFQSAVLAIVILTVILAEIGTFLIAGEVEVIISQIFYFPIIIIAFVYPRKAVPLSLCIGILYLVLSLTVPVTWAADRITPFMQFYVYVSLAVVLASFFNRFKVNETKYEKLFRLNDNAICIVDTATRTIVEMNPRFREILEVGGRQAGTLHLEELLPDLVPSLLPDPHGMPQETSEREISVKKADGTTQNLIFGVTVIGDVGLAAITLVDITKRKQAEQEIAAQASQLSIINRIISLSSTPVNQETLLKESLHTVLQALHFETGGIYLIDAPARMARLVCEENAPSSIPNTLREIPVDRFPFSVVLGNEALAVENITKTYPSEPAPEGIVSVAAVPIVSDGQVIGSLNVAGSLPHAFTDDEKTILRAIGLQLGAALEKIRTNDRLKREEENLHTLFDTIDDPVMILAADGRIIEINEAIIRKLGYSRTDLINRSVADISGLDRRGRITEILKDTNACRTGTCQVTLHTKEGVPVEVECQIREGMWNGENVLFGISRDVTERERVNEMLRSRTSILEAVSFFADRFLNEPIHGSTWTEEIPAVIERLGQATDAGRVCIFQNDPCPDNSRDVCISLKFEWTHPLFEPVIDNPLFKNLPLGQTIPDAFLQLSNGKPVCLTADQLPFLPAGCAQKNDRLRLVNIPIMADNHWWGILTIEQRSEDRAWSKIELDALMTAADILGAAIYHRTMVEIYRNPVESSLVGIFLLKDRVLEYVNPRFAEIFGYSREDLSGRPFQPELVALQDRELVERHQLWKAQGLEESSHYLLHGIKKDGSLIYLELFTKKVDYQGQSAIIGTIMDVTERMEVQEALQESEDMFRSLSLVAPVGIFLIDSRGNYSFVNDRWCLIMGLSRDVASSMGWLKAIHPNDRAAVEEQWRSFIEQGNEIAVEQRLLRKDGSITWIYLRAVARRNAVGKITWYVGTVEDITDRKKYEENLQSSLDEKSVLLMEVHHRVKNNLQIITGLIRLQARQITNGQALEALRECETRVLTIALVHESLYQSGNISNINAKRHITNLVNTLVMSNDNEMKIDMDLDVDDMPLDMNTAVPMSLIINELVTNSLKYAFSGRDHGTIRIGLHREPGNMLALTVGDDGVGIPPGMTLGKTGSLGMKLVLRLVRDQLKGDLRIVSDKGTSFVMRFPAAPATLSATNRENGENNVG